MMKSYRQDDWQLEKLSPENLEQLPNSFPEAVETVKNFALQELEKESIQKQLYYHNRAHVSRVQRRADRIFQVIYPYWHASLDHTASEYLTRMKLLLDLCAIAHDTIQEFIPQTQPHTPRRRESGVSERATIDKLMDYIEVLNQQINKQNHKSCACFQDSDLHIIQEAIEVTICLYDPTDGGIYQPALYGPNKNLSTISQIIALADIGSLGIEGVESYNEEGSLLFLEENPDIIPPLLKGEINYLKSKKTELYENFRQRLLKRSRWQVNFARSRFARYEREIEGFPSNAIPTLTNDVFKYLNQETIKTIEAITPTNDDVSLDALVHFFQLKRYVNTRFGVKY